MKLNLLLTYADGTEKTIIANAADLVAFEEKFSKSVAHLGVDTQISWLLYIAWHAEKRTGATKEGYEKWLESVDNIGATEQDPK